MCIRGGNKFNNDRVDISIWTDGASITNHREGKKKCSLIQYFGSTRQQKLKNNVTISFFLLL